MKKILFIAAAVAMTMASCGNKKAVSEEVSEDSLIRFEQSQIEASIKLQLDSLASQASQLKGIPGIQDGKIQLTEEQKMVKPDYLLDPTATAELTTMSEKYRALAVLLVDKKVAESYDMDITAYDEAIGKLLAEINDPALGVVNESATLEENLDALYNAENENGRINFFWELVTASSLEQIYILANNTDLYIGALDDTTAENITFRIILLTDAMDRLAEYDANIAELNDAMQPLKVLDAMSVEELKGQLEELREEIAAARSITTGQTK